MAARALVAAVAAVDLHRGPLHLHAVASRRPHTPRCRPSPASYLGVFEPGAPPGYAPIAGFARRPGKRPNLVGYYSGWARPSRRRSRERARAHGAIPYVQIDPTYASVSAIAAGTYDVYLRTYAESVRDFGHAVVIGFGHEMNAPGTRGATGTSRQRRSWPHGGTS